MPLTETPPLPEVVIDQDIDDTDAYLAYADWLQQRGDPRGEFILLCHRAAQQGNSAGAEARDRYLQAWGRQLLGGLHEPFRRGEIDLSWRLGFIDRLKIKPGDAAEAILNRLAAEPCCRYLRYLDLSHSAIVALPGDLDNLAWIQELDLRSCPLKMVKNLPLMARLSRCRVSGIPSSAAFDLLSWKEDFVVVGPLWLLAACYQAEIEHLGDEDFQKTLDGIELDEERHLRDLSDWSPAVCAALAKIDDGLSLSFRHWVIVAFLRVYFQEYQIAPAIRVLLKAFRQQFGMEWLSNRYFWKLFVYGPLDQAHRYAGMPKATGLI